MSDPNAPTGPPEPVEPTPPQPPPPPGDYAPPVPPAAPPPPPPGYSPPPQAAFPAAGQAGADTGQLSDWGTRALGYLIDYVPIVAIYIVGIIIAGVLGSIVDALGLLVLLFTYAAAIGWWVWNRAFMSGRTGQSLGRKVMGTRLVSASTGQPIGPGNAFVRDLAHILDSLACYVGWLFPIWDAKRQTFADKIMTTVVVPGDKQALDAAIRSSLPMR